MSFISDFDYTLPTELLAQLPSEKRHESKLMVIDKKHLKIQHFVFKEILNFFNKGDLLVFNNAKVIPARLLGKKETGGKVEVFLLENKSIDKEILWEVLVKPGIKLGAKVYFSNNFSCEVISVLEEGKRLVKFDTNEDFFKMIEKVGQIPLPPYIAYNEQNKELYDNRYQTVFAEKKGAVAAPTAGLHFSNELLDELISKGIETAFLTLYVGIGTFRPIKCDNYLEHKMHSENYELTQETIDKIVKTKKSGKRVIAVGTTSTRVLEGVYDKYNKLVAGKGSTDVFIYPGFTFKVIDGIITNFHLPKSSLLLMVSAFVNRDFIMKAYQEAIQRKYRFFSFGDAMLIL